MPQQFCAQALYSCFGGIVYYIVYTTVIYLGLDADLLKMLSAILVAFFLAVPYWKKTYFSGAANAEKRAAKQKIKAEKHALKMGKEEQKNA